MKEQEKNLRFPKTVMIAMMEALCRGGKTLKKEQYDQIDAMLQNNILTTRNAALLVKNMMLGIWK